MILIISDRQDPHSRCVQRFLEERGVPFAALDLAEIPGRSRLQAWIEGGKEPRFLIKRDLGPDMDLAKVKTIWFRRLSDLEPAPDLEDDDKEFAKEESLAFLLGLGSALEDRFWVNPMTDGLVTDRGYGKVNQLDLARKIGLNLPRTLFTNDPDAAREFCRSCDGGAIYKPFRSPSREREEGGVTQYCVVFTTKLDEAALEKLDGVAFAPCIFQEYVPKRLELRVTLIGNRVFACEIHSQVHEKSAVDFRRHYDMENTPYRPHQLPRAVEEKLLELNRRLGLVFGAYDLIQRPDGEYVFLEVNQSGQFLWLEEIAGLPLLEHFCEMLIQGRPDYACDAALHEPRGFPELPPLPPVA